MALYRYQALGEGGKKMAGVIDADSLASAKEKLLYEKILIVELKKLHEQEKKKVLKQALVLDFTRSLGQLLGAGLPLYESLQTLEEKYRKTRAHPLFLDLCDQLQSGSSFSAALERYPESFDPVYISMIKAAEQTGSLPRIFDELAQFLRRRQKTQKQLIAATIYPAFLGAFCCFIVAALLFFVIPTMAPLFEGRTLHPLTAIVLSTSRFLIANQAALLVVVVGVVGGFVLAFRRPEAKKVLQKLILKTPFLKTVVLQAALIRFTRSFGILLCGGIPLLDALKLSKKVTNHLLFQEVFEAAEKNITEGKPLSLELKSSPLIPPLVSRMAAIAEETGRMGPMMHHIADIYEDELEKNLQQLAALLQPALLLLLGLIVGVVLLSILIPLTDTNALI